MDTIKVYLDNMFARLPDTDEMRRLKAELLADMEDKYRELKAQGKGEHEAVGVVISEFGNIDELVEETAAAARPLNTEPAQAQLPMVDADTAHAFIAQTKRSARLVATGVLLCILSPIAIILLSASHAGTGQMFGLVPLFLCIAGAVLLFIVAGLRLELYNEIEKPHMLPEHTVKEMQQQQKEFAPKRIFCTAAGVMVIILGVLPVCISGWLDAESALLWCVCLLLIMVAIGVFLLVWSNMIYDGYNKILNKEDYTPQAQKENKITEAVGGVYWTLVTAAFLAWSFLTGDWGKTWIIWPIAGVVFGGIAALISALTCKND